MQIFREAFVCMCGQVCGFCVCVDRYVGFVYVWTGMWVLCMCGQVCGFCVCVDRYVGFVCMCGQVCGFCVDVDS